MRENKPSIPPDSACGIERVVGGRSKRRPGAAEGRRAAGLARGVLRYSRRAPRWSCVSRTLGRGRGAPFISRDGRNPQMGLENTRWQGEGADDGGGTDADREGRLVMDRDGRLLVGFGDVIGRS